MTISYSNTGLLALLSLIDYHNSVLEMPPKRSLEIGINVGDVVT
jgi:hypothetical protein